MASRVVDQAGLGLGSLLLARALGPEDFASIAALFIVYSLALQISDFGVGLAVYRTTPGGAVLRRSLTRMRQVDGAIALLGLAGGLLVGLAGDADLGAVVGIAGVVWALAAEVFVRKAAALKQGQVVAVASGEAVGSAVFLLVSAVLAAVGSPATLVGLLFVLKLVVELCFIRRWERSFDDAGEPARSGPEWLGQVMTYLVANVDYVLIAVLLGPADLSFYVIAFRFASAVPAFLAGPFTQTTFIEYAAAPFSSRQGIYEGLVSRLAVLGVCGAVVLLTLAPLLPVALGSDWNEVAPLMVVLSVAVPWRLALGMTVAVAITAGKARAIVAWETLRLVVLAALVALAAQVGLGAVAAAVSSGTILLIGMEHRAVTSLVDLRSPRWLVPATLLGSVGAVAVALAVLR